MPAELPPVCVLAGGRGTRLGGRTATVPKPLLEVAGAPFLHHQLRLLARHGARRVVLSVGYLGEQIEASVGPGTAFGLDVAYAYDGPVPAGTAGALRGALPLLGDSFLVLYGDTYLPVDYAAVAAAWRAAGTPALMTVLRNAGRWDASNADFDGVRVRYRKRDPDPAWAWIDYGLGVLTAPALDAAPGASDLADVYAALSGADRLAGFAATERFHEIGTPAALAETDAYLRAQGSADARSR